MGGSSRPQLLRAPLRGGRPRPHSDVGGRAGEGPRRNPPALSSTSPPAALPSPSPSPSARRPEGRSAAVRRPGERGGFWREGGRGRARDSEPASSREEEGVGGSAQGRGERRGGARTAVPRPARRGAGRRARIDGRSWGGISIPGAKLELEGRRRWRAQPRSGGRASR